MNKLAHGNEDEVQYVYDNCSVYRIVGCLAHARRKITDALSGMKAEKRKGTVAEEGLLRIEQILLLNDIPFSGGRSTARIFKNYVEFVK